MKQKNKDKEILEKACPALFSKAPDEVDPKFVSFQVPPLIFGQIKKWIDQGFKLEIAMGPKVWHSQISIVNSEALREYNKGRDPREGYPKDWKE